MHTTSAEQRGLFVEHPAWGCVSRDGIEEKACEGVRNGGRAGLLVACGQDASLGVKHTLFHAAEKKERTQKATVPFHPLAAAAAAAVVPRLPAPV